MGNEQDKGIKALGFLHKIDYFDPLCGVILINVRFALTDGYRMSEVNDLSEIFIAFGLILDHLQRTVCDVSHSEYIQVANGVFIAILLVSNSTSMRTFIP